MNNRVPKEPTLTTNRITLEGTSRKRLNLESSVWWDNDSFTKMITRLRLRCKQLFLKFHSHKDLKMFELQ